MEITPDSIIYFNLGNFEISATLVFTWIIMALIVVGSYLITRKLSIKENISKLQIFLESLMEFMSKQISDIMQQKPDKYLPFIGSLYIFIAVSNFFSFVPGYHAPTGSLQTTSVLAGFVFLAVPIYGILDQGLIKYLKHYVKPSPIMLPFNVIGELSRTLALSVRLFGNVMSGSLIIGIILSITPLFFPIIMDALELLIGQIQAYIFAVLSAVYIGSATRAQKEKIDKNNNSKNKKEDKK